MQTKKPTKKAKKPSKPEAKKPKGGLPKTKPSAEAREKIAAAQKKRQAKAKTDAAKARKNKSFPMTTTPTPTAPTASADTILHINPLLIKPAPELAAVPMMLDVAGHYIASKDPKAKAMGQEMDLEVNAVFASFEKIGIKEGVKATLVPDGTWQMWDGRHRLAWATAKNRATIPVIAVTEAEGRELMEATVIGRRHWLKGQRAYLKVLMHPEVAGNSRGAQKKISDSIGNNVTTTDLATSIGVSADTISQAVELYRLFYAPGAKAGSPEAIEAAALREKYEMSIWAGSGLGAVIAGIGGGEKTTGKPRAASGFHNLDAPLGALTRQAKAYEKWDADERAKANELLQTRLKLLPESFRLALSEALAGVTLA